jgi:glycosyltransferase involved in cell wall biosynthesis
MGRVSVIIPAYNAAATIAATVASALGQTHGDVEVIVVDDGSTDGTAAIVSTLAQIDARLRLLRYPNGGQAIARNRGIAAATGELIAFLDADDQWTPDKIADQVRALEENPEAAIAYGWTDYVDGAGRFLHRGSYVSLSGRVLTALVQLNFIENGSNVLVRRSALEAIAGATAAGDGPFEPALVPSEDWDLWLRLAERFAFVAIARPQVYYRTADDSQSANVRRLERSCRACLGRAFDRRPDLRAVRPLALANLYYYLLAKALASPPRRGWGPRSLPLVLVLWLRLLRYDRARGWRLRLPKLSLKVWLRAIALATVPGPWLRLLDRRPDRVPWRLLKRSLNCDTLLGHIQRPRSPDP